MATHSCRAWCACGEFSPARPSKSAQPGPRLRRPCQRSLGRVAIAYSLGAPNPHGTAERIVGLDLMSGVVDGMVMRACSVRQVLSLWFRARGSSHLVSRDVLREAF